jgi:hypothetical protein
VLAKQAGDDEAIWFATHGGRGHWDWPFSDVINQ